MGKSKILIMSFCVLLMLAFAVFSAYYLGFGSSSSYTLNRIIYGKFMDYSSKGTASDNLYIVEGKYCVKISNILEKYKIMEKIKSPSVKIPEDTEILKKPLVENELNEILLLKKALVDEKITKDPDFNRFFFHYIKDGIINYYITSQINSKHPEIKSPSVPEDKINAVYEETKKTYDDLNIPETEAKAYIINSLKQEMYGAQYSSFLSDIINEIKLSEKIESINAEK